MSRGKRYNSHYCFVSMSWSSAHTKSWESRFMESLFACVTLTRMYGQSCFSDHLCDRSLLPSDCWGLIFRINFDYFLRLQTTYYEWEWSHRCSRQGNESTWPIHGTFLDPSSPGQSLTQKIAHMRASRFGSPAQSKRLWTYQTAILTERARQGKLTSRNQGLSASDLWKPPSLCKQ